jgi:hypothetical protein
MHDTLTRLSASFSSPPPIVRGVQAWVTKGFRKELVLDVADRAIARGASAMMGLPITTEVAARFRVRMHSLRSTLPPVVQSPMVRSTCNAWTTTGRLSLPNICCPYSCGAQSGDKWVHFPGCPSIRRMWRKACPHSDCSFAELTLEHVLLLSPGLSK